MLGHTGNRYSSWGQLYHWVKQDNGKLKFVAGLEPIAGVEFSTERPVTEGPGFYIRDKDGPVPTQFKITDAKTGEELQITSVSSKEWSVP